MSVARRKGVAASAVARKDARMIVAAVCAQPLNGARKSGVLVIAAMVIADAAIVA
ncbi:hypothetical protein [Rhabdochromatium marinum]|uniref:hypothetical protein n=1 Tax=Rhabdochromatium marinum TaxID=48729 RepID=UPI0019065444|nr:hypothetical protein [Rhabdochromatium marinum]